MNATKSKAIKAVVLLGFVSLFADVTYEGARGITGPFLYTLGASAGIVGLVSGLGELTGYGVRLISGYISDKIRRYWLMTVLGYFINLVSVPLLAFAGKWEIASVLIIAERFGKAVRTPARDTIISYASSNIGYGKGFALHEVLDQIGAIVGPLIVASVIYASNSYKNAFLILGIPALLSLATLIATMIIYPNPEKLEVKDEKKGTDRFGKIFLIYLVFTALTICGYPHFQLVSYHFKKIQIVGDEVIPVLFAVAMGVDALTAIVAGFLFDRFRLKILFLIPIFSMPITILAFGIDNLIAVIFSVILWGIVMGFQETIMKSAIAELVTAERRGFAFGIFHGLFGLAWFVGSFIMGKLYEVSIFYLVLFSIALQVLSLLFYLNLRCFDHA
jgi:MFS family permease